MNWLRRLFSANAVHSNASRRRTATTTRRCWPGVEALEERLQPSAVSSIVSNFNGTAIQPGSTVWFNSVLKVSGLGAAPVTLNVTDASISFTANSTPYQVAVPDAAITFTPGATSAATIFDTASNTWVTSVPSVVSGNVFLAGAALALPAGLPGGINPVTYRATFTSDTAGVSVNWQWAAAVYTSFSSDYNVVEVKPVDSNQLSVYKNSDHAGTPEAFRSFVLGGVRGGGGSNYTGSYSGTGHVTAAVDSSVSGFVFDDTNNNAPMSGVTVQLSYMNTAGVMVTVSTMTNGSGYYAFTGLAAGTYNLSVVPPTNYTVDMDTLGTINGMTTGAIDSTSEMMTVGLGSGVNGINYDFYLGNTNTLPAS